MNLGAFALVKAWSHLTGREEMCDQAGLARRSPWLAISISQRPV
jgi:hypothetical protein